MRKWLLLLGLLLPSIASAQGVGNVVLKHYPGNPSGGCSANQMALNDSNGDLSICHNGMWMDVGGGAGGGISGTVSSPFVSYACAPDTLCDSAFGYSDVAMQFPTLTATAVDPNSGDNSSLYFGYTPSGVGVGIVDNATAGSFCGFTSSSNEGFLCTNGSGDQIIAREYGLSGNSGGNQTVALTFSTANLTLGASGTGGSLTINDQTMGSFALATDTANPVGAALEFTNVNTVGTGALDMSIFPDGMVTNVGWSAPGTMAPFVGWFIGPTTVKTIADIVDVNTTTLNPDTTGFPCGPMGLGDGQIAHFSDGDTNVWGAALTGGGALFVEAYCDGNNWLVMGAAASTGPLSATSYSTATNCANGAAPAVCGSAAAGHVAVPTGAIPTLVVNTSAVTATSEILLTVDESSTISGVTCNTTLSTLPAPVVTARTAATSFTIQVNATLLTNPACIGYSIVN